MNISTFCIGFSTAFFTIFALHILCFRRQRSHFQTVVGCIMAVWALLCLKDIVFTFPGMYKPSVLRWVMIIDGWSALTYAVFIFESTMPHWLSWRRMLLLVLPFVAFTVAYALWPVKGVTIAYAVFLWFFAWTIVAIGFFKARRQIAYVRQNYSDIERIDVSWLHPVFLFAIVTQLAWLVVSLYDTWLTDVLYYLICIALWLLMLHYSWDYHPILVPEPESMTVSREPLQRDYAFAGQLERTMEDEQLYLNSSLTLQDLAQAVGSNRTYVSNYLLQVRQQTFYDYVNQLRIEKKSIPLMLQHPEYTLEHVANESGFRSLSTFRRAFVKLTGKTPSQFGKQ